MSDTPPPVTLAAVCIPATREAICNEFRRALTIAAATGHPDSSSITYTLGDIRAYLDVLSEPDRLAELQAKFRFWDGVLVGWGIAVLVFVVIPILFGGHFVWHR